MALCCIGGVCIPYTAIVPLLILGIQWILHKLFQAGLLPSSWMPAQLGSSGKSLAALSSDCCSHRSGETTTASGTHVRRGKQSKVGLTTTTTSSSTSSCCEADSNPSATATTTTTRTTGTVVHCTTEDDWENLIRSSTTTVHYLAVKFTAKWCKPCQAIQPVFASLGTCNDNHQNVLMMIAQVQLVTVDVDDELAELSGRYNVLSLPTFVLLDRRTLTPVGGGGGTRYSGSDEAKLQAWWQSVSKAVHSKMS
jgi:thioredoxin 1